MRFTVDPWDPTYGTNLETELGESTAQVDVAVEVAAKRWRPLDPPPGLAPPPAVLFVDGVRRVEAQGWVHQSDGVAAPALCASYAAGVVCSCRGEGAHLLAAHVRRGLFTTATEGADVVTAAGTYRASHAAARGDAPPLQVLSLALQRELADVELVAAAAARTGPDDLLVLDGPLRGRQHLPRALGFVKSHRSDYLPPALGATVAGLGPGQRTPVFRIGSSWQRHTWYLRLPCAGGAPWAGVVRVECSAELPAAQATALAGLSQVVLVRYASTEYKDPRAPQNLYPIAGLERELRRRLGDAAMLYRALRRAAA
jgi:hypothetical protein